MIKDKIVFGARALVSTLFDKKLLKGTFLHIGSEDKSISLVKDGVLTNLNALLTLVYSSGKGYIKLPNTSALGDLIIQFGTATVASNGSTVVTLAIPFPNNTICAVTNYGGNQTGVSTHYQFQGTGNLTSLAIWADGGTGNLPIGWIAIGY